MDLRAGYAEPAKLSGLFDFVRFGELQGLGEQEQIVQPQSNSPAKSARFQVSLHHSRAPNWLPPVHRPMNLQNNYLRQIELDMMDQGP